MEFLLSCFKVYGITYICKEGRGQWK